jgi:hypothetical protein
MVIKIIGPDVAAMGSHGGTHSDANGLSRRSRIPRRGPHTEYLNELIANVFFSRHAYSYAVLLCGARNVKMGHWKRLSVGSQRSGSVGKVSGADSVIMSSYNLEGWSQS